MTVPTLPDVQEAIITKLKSSTIPSMLLDPKDIREVEWVGSVYKFPNVRVRVESFERRDADCDIFVVMASVLVNGEDASSKLTNTIASEIYNLLDRKTIISTKFKNATRIKARQIGANYLPEEGIWQSEVTLMFQVS